MANSVDPDETPRFVASHLGLHCLLRLVCPNTYGKYGNPSPAAEVGYVFLFLFFVCFIFGFYSPFKNISLISSRLFIKGGQKPENQRKNHLTIRKQNCDPGKARTTAVRNLMD